MNHIQEYYNKVNQDMQYIANNECEAINQSAELMSECISQNKKIYFFGTGHSYFVGQEVFARAGGYVNFTPILENELGMGHPYKSTLIERTSEYANIILGLYPFETNDVIVMTSNSGRNALTIELALKLKEIGVRIIAITSTENSKECQSRHSSGYRLFELADIVLDNRTSFGDASIQHINNIKTGPTSTIMDCFIIQLVVTAFVENEILFGRECLVYESSNTDQGNTFNQHLFK